jgi:glycosyltransferase involved in cell wall biosynthesis
VGKVPAVTVLLPAYNAARWLAQALQSILVQSFRDFELLIIDDGSTDATPAVLARCADPRVRVVRHDTNQGLIATLNEGIALSSAKYIARMDADDVAHPRRLAYQVNFMERHSEVGVCGTWFHTRRGVKRVSVRPPVRHEDISAALFFRSPFGHPTVMLRRGILSATGLKYASDAIGAEDFDLWVRLRPRTRFANVPKDLLEYRAHNDQVSSLLSVAQHRRAAQIRLGQLLSLVADPSPQEKALHLRLCDDSCWPLTNVELMSVPAWLDKLRDANGRRDLFDRVGFSLALDRLWFESCLRAQLSPWRALSVYRQRRYAPRRTSNMRNQLALASRALCSLVAA